ncbi:hypothetical protein [Kitasatospora sp. NPDC057738]|uniref:hypothetical protein n=1 Tax=Kitasatospora sp. NPDC057738 TaxID=3346233 RepID=UPI00369B3DB5
MAQHGQPGARDPDGERQQPAGGHDPGGCGAVGAGPAGADDPAEQVQGLGGGERRDGDAAHRGEAGQLAAGGDQYGARAEARQQLADHGLARGVVQDQQQPAPGERGAPEGGRPGRVAGAGLGGVVGALVGGESNSPDGCDGRDGCGARAAGEDGEFGEHLGQRAGGAVLGAQPDQHPAVREAVGEQVAGVHGERGLAAAGRAGQHRDAPASLAQLVDEIA